MTAHHTSISLLALRFSLAWPIMDQSALLLCRSAEELSQLVLFLDIANAPIDFESGRDVVARTSEMVFEDEDGQLTPRSSPQQLDIPDDFSGLLLRNTRVNDHSQHEDRRLTPRQCQTGRITKGMSQTKRGEVEIESNSNAMAIDEVNFMRDSFARGDLEINNLRDQCRLLPRRGKVSSRDDDSFGLSDVGEADGNWLTRLGIPF
ncbi:hypothetical protein LshimejAT787_1800300 [Lyophyllum shimeji]|uniref:Uncharacterized protein n=1 Tax=Lyophyllum shimeji TaxID=47721 RepID=A0A9P3UTK0_LYOSH|nr:hypothetical protein LshimejAT787_1800300 [Lyophyllum shimeji]